MRLICCSVWLLLVAACAPPQEGPYQVQDELGRTIQLQGVPKRLVTLAPNVTELVYAAGAGARVVGVTTADDYPPAVAELPRFSALPVDFEAIVALSPDLVLASDQVNAPNDAGTLEALGIPVYFTSVTGLDDLFESIRSLGHVLGSASTADHTAQTLEDSLAQLRSLLRDASSTPRTLFLIGDVTLYSFGSGSYIHEVIAAAGGLSITADLESRAPVLTREFVLTQQPAVIAITQDSSYTAAQLLAHHPTWDVVPAIRDQRVYGVAASLYLRPGPRLVTGTWKLAHALHPDLVPLR